jgi:hypothetical protein
MAISPRGPRTVRSNTQLTDSDLRHHSQELGWFGKIFGSRQQAAVIFAGVIGFVCAAGLIGVGILAPAGAEKADLLKSLVTIVIASFTFLGGIVGGGGGR